MSEARCRVCLHPERADIEAAMVGGLSNPATAARWGMSKDSVRRHRASHLSPALRAVAGQRDTAGPVRALDRLEELHGKASAILDAAMADGKPSLGLAAIRELRGVTETLARITGELDERPTVQVLNVATSPEWLETRGRLLAALAPYPEARQAAALALSEVPDAG